MSKAKTKIRKQLVKDFLKKNFDEKVSSITTLKGGEVSQAFSFSVNNKEYVIRVAAKEYNSFFKDKYAYENFSEQGVPIPEFYETEKFGDLYYAISQKVDGKVLDEFSNREISKLIPEIVRVLDSIHSVDISGKDGFGNWNNRGVARHNGWKEVLLGYLQDESENWSERYGNTFFEKELLERAVDRLQGIADSLPNIHYLVHADYGFDNLISNGTKITGVIDWEHSMYGDFLYDVAWLEFWAPDIGYTKIFTKFYKKKKINIENWDNRILSCIYYFGIGALGFFAESGQRKKYHWAKNRLVHYLDAEKV